MFFDSNNSFDDFIEKAARIFRKLDDLKYNSSSFSGKQLMNPYLKPVVTFSFFRELTVRGFNRKRLSFF